MESGALLAALLDAEPASEVDDRMVELVGGNPLFAEQYVRLLLDRGLLVRGPEGLRLAASEELPLPDTIQAVLAARLDTLPPMDKALLCDAAVIGESFWRGAVAALSACSPLEVDDAMNVLMGRDLVRPVITPSMEGEAEYLFWHALARDVAYAEMPRRTRLEKHLAAADWLEGAAGERADEFADILAHHYVTALDLAKALRDRERVASLTLPAGRHLVRAGEYNRATDSSTSERQLEQALESAAEGVAGTLTRALRSRRGPLVAASQGGDRPLRGGSGRTSSWQRSERDGGLPGAAGGVPDGVRNR